MSQSPEGFDIDVGAGRIHAHRFGAAGGRLTICVHGLSANSQSFRYLAAELAGTGRSVVAIDLRGRGKSAITRMGTYGWENHARDVFEVATALGAETFDLVGHSMGAFIGMQAAKRVPERIGRLALIDAVGVPEAASLVPIVAAVQRLGSTHRDIDAYLGAVKRLGTVEPWSELWEAHYRYDVIAAAGGVRPRTDRIAVMEDMAYGATQDPRSLWPSVTMKSLLVRSAMPLGGGFVVRASDARDFVSTAKDATSVEIDANHYGVMGHPRTASTIRRFLS